MTKVVGVKFNSFGKTYNFECKDVVPEDKADVIVETEQGLEFGVVATPPYDYDDSRPLAKPLKNLVRLAEYEDYERLKTLKVKEAEARQCCLELARELKIRMNPFMVKSAFISNKLTFFFVSEGRVDFRDLVKKLAKKFETKIEMRQVGVRNQAKMLGGIGRCGREICCCSYVEKFIPVSIKMAKQQGMSLNPNKTSGLCGRLMCCLNFENKVYTTLKKKMPNIGTFVETPSGKGKIVGHNPIAKKVTVKIKGNQIVDMKSDEIEVIK
ncbi:MAG: stage 0 sporulation protein [Deltaproteobacteria bacterium]|nr:stage 0 sporulation protein [Deltaproteobacteria bacterium]